MNCTDMASLVLLQDSGELLPGQQRELDEHLSTCGACRMLKADLGILRNTLQAEASQRTGPSRQTLTLIRKASKRGTSPAPRVISAPWRIALATAASLALCLTTLRFSISPTPPAAQAALATEIIPLIAIITGVDHGLLTMEGDDTELTVMANELLRLQEMAIEWPVDKYESPTPHEDCQPTTLLLNNSRGSLSGKCV
ncbi:MAG: zf-HC2 domain-containing protein [bacterium]|jgi:predicted anti-sigma-YlaC factor YlaD